MTYKGHVENGIIVLDEPVMLEEGTTVEVAILGKQPSTAVLDTNGSNRERYASLFGVLDDMPADWSERHDGYLHPRNDCLS